jgi:hypothetical protein
MPKQNSNKKDSKVIKIEAADRALIFPLTVAEGFTQSEFSEMSCFQRWNNRYNQLLVKPGEIQFPFSVGSIFHDAMEQFYLTKGERVHVATLQFKETDVPSLVDIQKKDYWNHVIPAMVEAYMIYYKADPIKYDILHVEKELDVVYRGFRLRGKIDLKVRETDGIWIWDHKTMSRLNHSVVAGWDFRFQFMFYIWLMSMSDSDFITGYVVNGVKKPELRVKQNESLPTFAARVREDMIINPDKYFFREKYPLTKDALAHFQTEVVDPKLDKLQFIIDNPTSSLAKALMIDKNTSECQKWGGAPCAYIDLCRHGEKMKFLYTTKPAKHEELEEQDVE